MKLNRRLLWLAASATAPIRTDAAGVVNASRPLYPYPALAKYSGTGDANAAANYGKGAALHTAPVPDWTGVDSFPPYLAAPL